MRVGERRGGRERENIVFRPFFSGARCFFFFFRHRRSSAGDGHCRRGAKSQKIYETNVCTELNETVNGGSDMLSGIATALQNVSATPAASKRSRSSDLIQRKTWKAATKREKLRHSMSEIVDAKRGLMTERPCLSALRAPTRTRTAHFQ